MASIDNLEAWKLGVDVAVRVCRLKGCKPLVYYPELGGQLARAALSVPANVAEGYALGTRAQMIKGLRIAFGSALELRTHFEVAVRIPAVPDSEPTRSWPATAAA